MTLEELKQEEQSRLLSSRVALLKRMEAVLEDPKSNASMLKTARETLKDLGAMESLQDRGLDQLDSASSLQTDEIPESIKARVIQEFIESLGDLMDAEDASREDGRVDGHRDDALNE